jgi:RNAse (barnase) inhibitor barstar
MSQLYFEFGDPEQGGVFLVAPEDLEPFAAGARAAGLAVREIDLRGCLDKTALLQRMAAALEFPAGFGANWDALLDSLRDLGWLAEGGVALLFGETAGLRGQAPADFAMLVEILEEAASAWRAAGLPFWALLAAADDFEA